MLYGTQHGSFSSTSPNSSHVIATTSPCTNNIIKTRKNSKDGKIKAILGKNYIFVSLD